MTAGVDLRAGNGEEISRLHLAFMGCSPVRVDSGRVSQIRRHHCHRCQPVGQDLRLRTIKNEWRNVNNALCNTPLSEAESRLGRFL